jgi:hypothetical protein
MRAYPEFPRRPWPSRFSTKIRPAPRPTRRHQPIPLGRRGRSITTINIDRLLVARYDANASWFRRHRDNAADDAAFRRFAISVDLNAGEYDGGHLLVPEYNDHRYRPPTGAGIVFSAAILHAATPVTRGCRYVSPTVFHDAAAEARRRDHVTRTTVPAKAEWDTDA